MEAAVEFEKLTSLAALEATDSMPGSVCTRYNTRLAALRGTLQKQRHAYPLGAILVSIGAITDEQLNRALRSQQQSQTKKLLGEFLVEMDLISREKLSHALAIQGSTAPQTPRSSAMRSKHGGGLVEEKTAVLEFERLRQEYAVQDARGTPMSVHDRYRKALAGMRSKIRETRSDSKGNRLGELLLKAGALDLKQLQHALDEQRKRNRGELLGEVLLALGLINEGALLSALRIQANSHVIATGTDESIAIRESRQLTTTRAKSTVQ